MANGKTGKACSIGARCPDMNQLSYRQETNPKVERGKKKKIKAFTVFFDSDRKTGKKALFALGEVLYGSQMGGRRQKKRGRH